MRPVDADALMAKLNRKKAGPANQRYTEGFNDCLMRARSMVHSAPTLTPPNEPLTIKQLQKMVGEPVYDYLGQEWYVIQEYYDHELTMTDGTRFFDDDEIDGVDKRFYRRPPEGEEDT